MRNCFKSNPKPGDAVYGLGLIGAAIYYISTATTFWIGVLGFLKAHCMACILSIRVTKILNRLKLLVK